MNFNLFVYLFNLIEVLIVYYSNFICRAKEELNSFKCLVSSLHNCPSNLHDGYLFSINFKWLNSCHLSVIAKMQLPSFGAINIAMCLLTCLLTFCCIRFVCTQGMFVQYRIYFYKKKGSEGYWAVEEKNKLRI